MLPNPFQASDMDGSYSYAGNNTVHNGMSIASMVSHSPQAITVTLQYGSSKELIVVERSQDPHAFELFRQKARQMAERHRLDGGAPGGAGAPLGELHLFVHDYNSAQMLQHLSSLAQLENGCVVEIIRIERNERPTRPHCLQVLNYKTPTFCDYCGEILVGLIKQGLQCSQCKCNFHKKCAFAPRNNCAKNELIPNTFLATAGFMQAGGDLQQLHQQTTMQSPQAFAMPHTLSVHNYKTPTVCKVCDKLLLGLIKQGLRCRDCKVNVHKKCANQLPMNCQLTEGAVTNNFDQMSVSDTASQNLMDMDTVGDNGSQLESIDSMIPLARLPGSASSRAGRQAPLCEGWVIHFVLTEPERRLRHYWILQNGAISMYNEYNDGVNPNRVFKQIPLAEIIAIAPYDGQPVSEKCAAPHCFEIRTTSNVTYCVGENLDALSGGAPPTKLPRQCGPYGIASWQTWFQALQQALQPPPLRTDPANAEPALQFSQLYQILRDKVLGSGQFGTVYSGIHRQTSREVAVKVIAKDRFSKKSSAGVETLKSEVMILQEVNHEGIIKLESMFETKDKIFVVMEKMYGDMLELILSQATGRLDERSTRFIIIQILSALRYLHTRGIAHCDLKPENVLLSDLNSNFPQTKLCDFGYARFIGDTQFRKTIVGTPAYLAPEVLQKKGYNKSLDMWSVGVIIYVTLSGTFPFNDGEEISEQIQNAAFMFPADLWKNISANAIDLIQRLLKLKIEERMNIEECIVHEWLQDPQVYLDLRQLEIRLGGLRYLTSESDDVRFAPYLQQMGLLPATST